MQVAAPQGIKIYNVSAGKSLADWILEKRESGAKLKNHDRMEILLLYISFFKINNTVYYSLSSGFDSGF